LSNDLNGDEIKGDLEVDEKCGKDENGENIVK